MREDFVEQVRPMLRLGVDVVVLAGGYPMLLFARERGFPIDGAVVLNGLPVALAAAETAVRLSRLNGTQTSRRGGLWAAPSDAVEEFRNHLV